MGYFRFVLRGGELVPVVPEELEGLAVVPLLVVVPGHGVDARVREDLVSLLTQEPEEPHLDWTHGVVADLDFTGSENKKQFSRQKIKFLLLKVVFSTLKPPLRVEYHPFPFFLQGMFGILLAWTSG